MTLTIGLTGGIGSGKSTVANLFAELGVPVFDTDKFARQLVEPGQPALQKVVDVFGFDMLTEEGKLNRDKLKQQIFNNEQDRQKLENILHPEIREKLLASITECTEPYCIVVIPLLIEKNWQEVVDRVLVVDLPRKSQIERTLSRDNISEELASQIINTQVSRDQRLALADDIIDNSGDPQSLANQVNKLHQKYLELSSTR